MEELYRDKWTAVVSWFRRHGSQDPENDAANTFFRAAQAEPGELTAAYLWVTARRVRIDSFRRAEARPQTQTLPTDFHVPVDPWVGLDEMLDVQEALPKLTAEQRRAILSNAAGYFTRGTDKKRRQRGLVSLRRLVA